MVFDVNLPRHEIPPVYREEILRRLEKRFEDRCFSMSINDYAELLLAILPEDFAEPPVDEFISKAAPGSPLRMSDYETRHTMRLSLHHYLDHRADGGLFGTEEGHGAVAGRSLRESPDPTNPGGWADRRECVPIPSPVERVRAELAAHREELAAIPWVDPTPSVQLDLFAEVDV